MRRLWSAFEARVSNRLARHFRAAPLRLPPNGAMVSFTFDDIPDSAADAGAAMLEEFGARGTFYVAGSLIDRPSEHWHGVSCDRLVELHRGGHEIACHTFSHKRAIELDAAAMEAEIERNSRYFAALDPSIRLTNFAYPYGLASLPRKTQLAGAFRSSRGILPGVNSDVIDLQFLRANPLIDLHMDGDGIDRAFDEAVAARGWLIFYGHDVVEKPSPYGCTPNLLRHALESAARRDVPVLTVADALRRAGA